MKTTINVECISVQIILTGFEFVHNKMSPEFTKATSLLHTTTKWLQQDENNLLVWQPQAGDPVSQAAVCISTSYYWVQDEGSWHQVNRAKSCVCVGCTMTTAGYHHFSLDYSNILLSFSYSIITLLPYWRVWKGIWKEQTACQPHWMRYRVIHPWSRIEEDASWWHQIACGKVVEWTFTSHHRAVLLY